MTEEYESETNDQNTTEDFQLLPAERSAPSQTLPAERSDSSQMLPAERSAPSQMLPAELPVAKQADGRFTQDQQADGQFTEQQANVQNGKTGRFEEDGGEGKQPKFPELVDVKWQDSVAAQWMNDIVNAFDFGRWQEKIEALAAYGSWFKELVKSDKVHLDTEQTLASTGNSNDAKQGKTTLKEAPEEAEGQNYKKEENKVKNGYASTGKRISTTEKIKSLLHEVSTEKSSEEGQNKTQTKTKGQRQGGGRA